MEEHCLDFTELLNHYRELLELYKKMEAVSYEIFHALSSGSRIGQFSTHIRDNMALANRISEESQTIASIKKTLIEKNELLYEDRIRVREAEQLLSRIVDRVMDQEIKNRTLVMQQGVKISRK